MRKIEFILGLIFCAVVLASCERSEIPISYEPVTTTNGTFSTQVDMSSDYRYRLYYDLESDSVVAMHQKTDWDLGFSSNPETDRIRLNDSKLMSAWHVEGVGFDEVQSIQGDGPLYDSADGIICALDAWEIGSIYIIDRGYDEAGAPQGRYKIQITASDIQSYTLRFAPLMSGQSEEVVIDRDESRNQVHLSFENGVLLLEPPKTDWDLLFTHYTFYFEEEEIPYLVAGALINPYLVSAQELEIFDFDLIDSGYLDQVILSQDRDVIGYDWKYFDLDAETYSVLDNAYVIRTVEGNRCKLQFTSFINASGQRGAPAFNVAFVP